MALSKNFDLILKLPDLRQVKVDSAWADTVVLVDAPYPDHTIGLLKEMIGEVDLSRTIVLLRGSQAAIDFRDVVGFIGAVLPNNSTVEEVGLVARVVRQGLFLAPTEMLSLNVLVSDETPEDNAPAELTEREQHVLALICEGAGNKVIARKLDISDSTVRVHVRAILRKLGLQNRTQAALYAVGRLQKPMRPASFMN
ncbi:DNA-binding response regulator [Limoniibacter endophyticus]|uniref:DNA-binding response regulator n=2 Tax=Limoniibacter endophyticus TaxID=1565040 RepID=A0A8J3DHX0_9HYPH|nr:DNA-binding response regulator [Limoniibacter endophyticus]